MGEYRKFKNLIDKQQDGFTSENMDSFKGFRYVPQSKRGHSYNPEFNNQAIPSHSKMADDQQRGNPTKAPGYYRKTDQEKFTSEYADKLGFKQIQNHNDMVSTLEQNLIEQRPKSRELARVKKAQRERQEFERVKREQEEEEANESEYGEEEGDEEDSEGEEEIEYEEPNYQNVQNRLLSHTKKAKKPLDPVYQKKRLQRRQERIKVDLNFFTE